MTVRAPVAAGVRLPLTACVLAFAISALGAVRADAASTTQISGSGGSPAISANGRFVAYTQENQVFLFDRETETTELVSETPAGTLSSGVNEEPSVSGDGRYVVFRSDDDELDLAAPEVHGRQIFIYDRDTGDVRLLSTATNQVDREGLEPYISRSGRFVTFTNSPSCAALPCVLPPAQVYLYDRVSGATELVSIGADGQPMADGATTASVSDDGRFVAFKAVWGEVIDAEDVLLRDRQEEETRSLTGGVGSENQDRAPCISADGRYVGFTSGGDIIVGDSNNVADVVVYDRVAEALELVSLNDAQEQGNHGSAVCSITPDGRYIAFYSSASNLANPDANGSIGDVFIRDRAAGTTDLVSIAPGEAQFPHNDSLVPTTSADARLVAFQISFPPSGVFLRDRSTSPASQPPPAGQPGNDDVKPSPPTNHRPPFVVRAIGDSITAGFGYFADGSRIKSPDHAFFHCKPPPLDNRCSSPNRVAYPAIWARAHGIEIESSAFRNNAVSGSTPADWLGGQFKDTLAATIADQPDLILLTLGGNPILSNFAFKVHGPEYSCMALDLTGAKALRCLRRTLRRHRLIPRLTRIYRRLASETSAYVGVMLYYYTVPAFIRLVPKRKLKARLLLSTLNSEISTAFTRARNSLPPRSRGRLRLLNPGRFQRHGCSVRQVRKRWVLRQDLCIHPTKMGHLVLARAVEAKFGNLVP